MGEIPETVDAQRHQFFCAVIGDLFGDAQDCSARAVGFAKSGKSGYILNHQPIERLPDDLGVDVKYPFEPEPTRFEMHMLCDCAPKVARAQQDCAVQLVQPHDVGDLLMERRYIITVSLLTESAKAVQILPDLRRGELHELRKFTGRDAGHIFFQKITQKPVISGETSYHRAGNPFIFWHKTTTFTKKSNSR